MTGSLIVSGPDSAGRVFVNLTMPYDLSEVSNSDEGRQAKPPHGSPPRCLAEIAGPTRLL